MREQRSKSKLSFQPSSTKLNVPTGYSAWLFGISEVVHIVVYLMKESEYSSELATMAKPIRSLINDPIDLELPPLCLNCDANAKHSIQWVNLLTYKAAPFQGRGTV